MTVETKSNGYNALSIQPMRQQFEKAEAVLFPNCTISHFYYGDHVDKADVILRPGEYAHFNISANRISLCGYTCSTEDLTRFGSLTYRDECYKGKLFDIA